MPVIAMFLKNTKEKATQGIYVRMKAINGLPEAQNLLFVPRRDMPHADKQLFGGRMNQAIIDMWKEDIDQLALELPQKHKNLFFQLPKEHFRIS